MVPAYREDRSLSDLLASLSNLKNIEVIVSISEGDRISAETASKFKVRIVEGKGGRGIQLHAGAMAAKGDTFVFCHADTILPAGWHDSVCAALWNEGAAGGAFRLRIDTPKLSGRIVSFGALFRCKAFGLVYGDQAIFTTAETYRTLGGFLPIPIMEDLDFVRRLRRKGRFVLLGKTALTSPRRWEAEGYLYCTLRNAMLLAFYLLGLPPATLAGWHRRRVISR